MTIDFDVGHRLGAFALEARFHSDGGVTALFGRSGTGKTSIVGMIAGLVRPERGRIVVDGRVLFDSARRIFVPAHKRRIGYVFQEGRLFPHLSVRQNLLFGRWFTPTAERRGGVDAIVALLGIGHLLDRRPGLLSGGEKQRVAIGRALLASPRLLLMDEPLASLDAERKAEILPYIERLRDELRLPIVYVSHAIEEVARLATSVVLMEDGRVVAAGSVAEIMGRLDLQGVIGRFDAGAVWETRVQGHDPTFGLTTLRSKAGDLHVPGLDQPVGAAIRVRIRARDVMVAVRRPEGLSARNILPGRVAEIGAAAGGMTELRLDCGGEALLARVTLHAVSELDLAVGREIFAVIKSITFDPQGVSMRSGEEKANGQGPISSP